MTKSPHEMGEELLVLAHEYGVLSEAYAGYMKLQADYYHTHRHEHKSDTSVMKAWERTEDGITMAISKMKIRSHEKKMSAIRTMLRLAENEAKNLF